MSRRATPVRRPPAGGHQQTQNGHRIMVVDDDLVLLEALGALLDTWGFDVLPFSTFDNARMKLADGRCADTLLVDVRIGTFNGLQLLHLAKQVAPAMTVIAMSGFDDPVLRAEAATMGAAFLLKPIEPSELHKHLSQAL